MTDRELCITLTLPFAFKYTALVNKYTDLHGPFPTLQQITDYTTTQQVSSVHIHAPFVVPVTKSTL
jgi:hypothetical protein